MSKNIKLGDVSIPITQYASQGNAVLGIRDSGKSYTATYLAEQLYAAGIPFVAFDPSGVWKFLRVPGAGKGLPVVVAGGKEPDLPLTPQSAPEIVRAAMKANVSLVIDLYDIQLSKTDWGRIVESCIRVLLYENGEHGLRHIFIEEAAEFAPQQIQGDKARVYAEVEKLARIGGNALLGYTLINQRAEQVNKAVLELCDCLFLHRQKGKNSLNSLSKWLEYSQGGDTKQIIKGLPILPSGQCWVWPANAQHATLVKMPQKNTFHPDRRALIANPASAKVARVDATSFVTELKASLDKVLQEADANDPNILRKRIAELERELRTPKDLTIDKAALEQEYKRGYGDCHLLLLNKFRDGFKPIVDKLSEDTINLLTLSYPVLPTISLCGVTSQKQAQKIAQKFTSIASGRETKFTMPDLKSKPSNDQPPSVRKILDVIHSSYPVSISFEAAARRAAISNKSSAYEKYRNAVIHSDEIEQVRGGRFISLPEFAKQGSIDSRAGVDQWIAKLPPSFGNMLKVIQRQPGLDKIGIAHAASISPNSSGLGTGLRELMDLQLIECENGIYSLAEGLN